MGKVSYPRLGADATTIERSAQLEITIHLYVIRRQYVVIIIMILLLLIEVGTLTRGCVSMRKFKCKGDKNKICSKLHGLHFSYFKYCARNQMIIRLHFIGTGLGISISASWKYIFI